MIPGEWIEPLRLLHGGYNTLIGLAVAYQGWLGLRIRNTRRGGGDRDFGAVRRHRGNGPVLALLGALGYVAGAALIALDKGHLFAYPLHHLLGTAIVTLIAATFLLSRQIRGLESRWRTPHFLLGLAILAAYLLQLFLGLNILL